MATLSLDQALYQQTCEAAAAPGKSVEVFVDETWRQAIALVGLRRIVRNGLPVMMVSQEIAAMDPARVHRYLEEEGL